MSHGSRLSSLILINRVAALISGCGQPEQIVLFTIKMEEESAGEADTRSRIPYRKSECTELN